MWCYFSILGLGLEMNGVPRGVKVNLSSAPPPPLSDTRHEKKMVLVV